MTRRKSPKPKAAPETDGQRVERVAREDAATNDRPLTRPDIPTFSDPSHRGYFGGKPERWHA